jgi:O-antigen/teichoic acid export membrane protein
VSYRRCNDFLFSRALCSTIFSYRVLSRQRVTGTEQRRQGFKFARLLSSAVISQSLLSAGNFGIGLILIRNASTIQYGYYVLVFSAILLLISLQNAFFNPPLAIRLPRLDQRGRSELIGGLYREQRRLLPALGAIVVAITLALWSAGRVSADIGSLVLTSVFAILAILRREYLRMVLFAHRRPQDVLPTDIVYILLAVAGVYLATLTPAPALVAVLALGLAALVSGLILMRTLRRFESWDTQGARGILREIAPLASWSTAGAAIHWSFSQGYIYLVASTLSITAVSSIAATRILMMPVNLLSTGIGSLMLPLASNWLHQHGARRVWQRLLVFALGLALTTLCYFAVLWELRDWIFAVVLKKEFAQRDALLLLWGGVILVIVMRDQLVYLLAAQGRFRTLTTFTFVCAVISLVASYAGMLRFGVSGALMGMLLGESINVAGIVYLSFRSTQVPAVTAPALRSSV